MILTEHEPALITCKRDALLFGYTQSSMLFFQALEQMKLLEHTPGLRTGGTVERLYELKESF